MSKDTRLHYVRLLKCINDMYDTIFNSSSIEKGECDYYNTFGNKDYKYLYYDLNSISFLCTIALMGLNKESIESFDNHQNYEYDVTYSVPDYKKIVDTHLKQFNLPESKRTMVEDIIKGRDPKYSFFMDSRTYPTPFDIWLRINKQNNLPNFDYNYLSCVRDAFMHSEYEMKESPINEKYSTVESLVRITNSDYKKLEGDIFLPNFFDFIKFYYSNTAYYGIMSRLLITAIDAKDNKKITSEEELVRILNSMTIKNMDISNDSKDYKTSFESCKIKNKGITFAQLSNDDRITYTDIPFDDDKKKMVVSLIKEYIGDNFYQLDRKLQFEIILYVINYIFNTRIMLSAGLIAIYENAVAIGKKEPSYRDLALEGYCLKPLILLLKSYIVLYRLQNKEFVDIDYSKMELVNFTYSENDPYHHDLYLDYKNKLIARGINEDEDTYSKMYFTEIFRDALAHGNVSIDFSLDDDQVIQKLVFNDIYKGKTRSITISFDELKRYMDSECFSRSEARLSEDEEEQTRK